MAEILATYKTRRQAEHYSSKVAKHKEENARRKTANSKRKKNKQTKKHEETRKQKKKRRGRRRRQRWPHAAGVLPCLRPLWQPRAHGSIKAPGLPGPPFALAAGLAPRCGCSKDHNQSRSYVQVSGPEFFCFVCFPKSLHLGFCGLSSRRCELPWLRCSRATARYATPYVFSGQSHQKNACKSFIDTWS